MTEDKVVWVAPSTFTVLGDDPGPCFFCGAPTLRIDVCYSAHYCGTHEEEIALDIEWRDKQRGITDAEDDIDIFWG